MRTQKIMSQFGLILTIALMFASCSKSKLQLQIELANRQCPISMGTMGEMTSITYEDDNVTFSCEINEEFINIDKIKENADLIKENAIVTLMNSTGDIKTLIDELEKAGAGLALKYKGKQSGKEFSITFTPEEIASAGKVQEEDKDPMELLNAQIDAANLQCPIEAAQGMEIESISVEGDFVVYNVTTDESIYSIEQLNAGKKTMKQAIKESLKETDEASEQLLKLCKMTRKGIAYKYVGNTSGEVCFIEIASSEL